MRTVSLACAVLLAALPAFAADGASLAADHGCLNCHGVRTHPHEAPLLKDMTARLARQGEAGEAARHALHEMREKQQVHAHQFVSDESALAILRWMAQGAAMR